MRFQIASDLHLEKYPLRTFDSLIEPKCDTLALLGDIGDPRSLEYRQFLLDAGHAFKTVLIIAGNHEYYNDYGHTIFDTNLHLQELCREVSKETRGDIKFLNDTFVVIDNVLIYGATLWSWIPFNKREQIQKMNYDFKKIPQYSVEEYTMRHQQTVRNILNLITKKHKNIVVLSHHTPWIHGTSAKRYEGTFTNCCFSTDLSDMMEAPELKVWCYGHTHFNNTQTVNKTLLTCNQKGHIGEVAGYERSRVVRVNEGLLRRRSSTSLN